MVGFVIIELLIIKCIIMFFNSIFNYFYIMGEVMSKISVIVPAYNSSEKILRCVNSIIGQTFKDLEIILVDDGSTDDTLNKMNYLLDNDSRIIVLENNKNMGAWYSRNKGIDIATGEYITFVDSDDFLSLDTYSSVNSAIDDFNSPDIVRYSQNSYLDFGKYRVNISFFSNNIFNNLRGVLNPKESHEYVALETPGVCNKVFKRSLIADTRFPNFKWEDYPFCTFLLGKADSVAFSNSGKYFYCHSSNFDNTTMKDTRRASSNLLDIYDCCDLVEKQYKAIDMFCSYEDAIRGNQKIHSLQRVRDIMFSREYSFEEKNEIINLFLRLTEVKYGNIFLDSFYRMLKNEKPFYRMRMDIVENLIYDSSFQVYSSENDLKLRLCKKLK